MVPKIQHLAQIIAVYNNTEKEKFTIGIVDDVTNLSLEVTEHPVTTPASNNQLQVLGTWSRWYRRC